MIFILSERACAISY